MPKPTCDCTSYCGDDPDLRSAKVICGAWPDGKKPSTAPQDAASTELQRIHAVVMNVGGEWPDDATDPYTLRHVKWMARELTKRTSGVAGE